MVIKETVNKKREKRENANTLFANSVIAAIARRSYKESNCHE
jgi:hypothetical protein